MSQVAPRSATASAFWSRALAPACGLVLLALGAAFWQFDRALYFRFLALWGLPTLPAPFADWQAVVGLMHCAAHGVDVYVAGRCGVFSYSPLWSWAALIPTDWAWRTAAGLMIDSAFFASLWFVYRPRGWADAALFTLACISPAAAYGAERANVDLILFMMMLTAAAAFAGGGLLPRMTAYLIIGLAGLLKFYPFAGLVIALRETTRRFVAIAVLTFAALAALLFAIRGDLASLAAGIPGGEFDYGTFGAPNVLYLLLGPTPAPIAWNMSLAVLGFCCLAVSLWLARGPGLARAMSRLDNRDGAGLLIGAAVVVGCFFAGQSNNYRAIFLILVIAGLLSLRRVAEDAATRRRLGLLIAGALALMWFRAAQLAFYPVGTLASGFSVVLAEMTWWRELIWWGVIAWLLALLMIFAARSKSLGFLRPWLVDGLGVGAADRRP
jgi:hypothetical protein